jgi:hypothetical protein
MGTGKYLLDSRPVTAQPLRQSLWKGTYVSRYRRLARFIAALSVAITTAALPATVAAGDGAADCSVFPPPPNNGQAGEVGFSGGFEIGGRATYEGQTLPLCSPGTSPSGAFHWAALELATPNPNNIVQVGYGHCLRADNSLGLGTVCNGNYYWYWAWGSDCGAGVTGSGGANGPIPIRIGAAMSTPPAATDIYLLREVVGGISYYDGYVNGVLLQGLDALNNQRMARIAASSVCWNSTDTNRAVVWFGETFNVADDMGGWVNNAANHLDYTNMRYSINTGWKTPSIPTGACDAPGKPAGTYFCTVPTTDHIYIDTVDR